MDFEIEFFDDFEGGDVCENVVIDAGDAGTETSIMADIPKNNEKCVQEKEIVTKTVRSEGEDMKSAEISKENANKNGEQRVSSLKSSSSSRLQKSVKNHSSKCDVMVSKDGGTKKGKFKGKNPLSCRYCHKKFPFQSKLDLHENIHTGEKLFPCSLCQKKFNSKSNLKRHVENVRHKKVFKQQPACCAKIFSRPGNLKNPLKVRKVRVQRAKHRPTGERKKRSSDNSGLERAGLNCTGEMSNQQVDFQETNGNKGQLLSSPQTDKSEKSMPGKKTALSLLVEVLQAEIPFLFQERRNPESYDSIPSPLDLRIETKRKKSVDLTQNTAENGEQSGEFSAQLEGEPLSNELLAELLLSLKSDESLPIQNNLGEENMSQQSKENVELLRKENDDQNEEMSGYSPPEVDGEGKEPEESVAEFSISPDNAELSVLAPPEENAIENEVSPPEEMVAEYLSEDSDTELLPLQIDLGEEPRELQFHENAELFVPKEGGELSGSSPLENAVDSPPEEGDTELPPFQEDTEQPPKNVLEPAVQEKTRPSHLQYRKRKEKYPCTHCKKVFLYPSLLKKHEITHSKPKRQPYSREENVLESALQEKTRPSHLQYRKRKEEYPCSHCKMEFPYPSLLKRHEITHSHSKPFKCQQCSREFATVGTLIRHEQTVHSKVKPHLCDKCGKLFSLKHELKLHQISHTNEKNFSCGTCKMKFKHASSLKHHMPKHGANRKLYPCSLCESKYVHSGSLNRHVAIDHGAPVKVYECLECEKKFAFSYNLKNHLRVHTGETPFACKKCARKFKHTYSLKLHALKCVFKKHLRRTRSH